MSNPTFADWSEVTTEEGEGAKGQQGQSGGQQSKGGEEGGEGGAQQQQQEGETGKEGQQGQQDRQDQQGQQGEQGKEGQDDFNRDAFVEEFKGKNPNATDEEIQSAAEKAENDFYAITAEKLFGESDGEKGDQGFKTVIDSIKQIAGDDLDETELAVLKSPEDVQNIMNKIVENRVEKSKAEFKLNNDFVNSMDDEGKAIFNVLKDKGLKGVQDYLMPNQRIASLMNMDDTGLVVEQMRSLKDQDGNRIYTDEEVSEKVGKMDDNELTKQASAVRARLGEAEAHQRKLAAQKINQDAEKRKNQDTLQKQEMAQKIVSVASSMKDFYGLPIDETLVDSFAREYVKGTFDHLDKDPNFRFKSILFHKFGDMVIRRHGKAKFEEGLKKRNTSDHNADLPDKPGGGNSGGSQQQGKGFGSWNI
jgi:hypothetical protein